MISLLLVFAILMEGFGATMLKLSNGFKKPFPILGVILGFGTGFYCLTIVIQYLPLSYTYATWAGCGTALTALIGYLVFKESFNTRKVSGIVLIVLGVFVINFLK